MDTPAFLCLHLAHFLVNVSLRFPLRKLPLSFLALEKCLYLQEQDTGQGFHLVIWYPGAVVIGFHFSWHGIPPSKLILVKQIALEHSTVSGDEAAPCVLGNLVSSTGVVLNDLREYIVRSAAHPEVQVVLDLAGNHICVWALGNTNKMDIKSLTQPGQVASLFSSCFGTFLFSLLLPVLSRASATSRKDCSLSLIAFTLHDPCATGKEMHGSPRLLSRTMSLIYLLQGPTFLTVENIGGRRIG